MNRILQYLKNRNPAEKKKNPVQENIRMLIEVFLYVFFINSFLLQSQVIPTGSMEDTMLIGDHLLLDKVCYSPSLGKLEKILFPKTEIKRGMIVAFRGPPEIRKNYVKRIIGLPGETIEVQNNKVYINDVLLPEPYVFFKGETHPLLLNHPRRKIPEGNYFAMGDNRNNSSDSRIWGLLPATNIIGKPWLIYWSVQSTKEEYLTPGVIHKVKDIFKTMIHFFSRTRWNRTFKRYK